MIYNTATKYNDNKLCVGNYHYLQLWVKLQFITYRHDTHRCGLYSYTDNDIVDRAYTTVMVKQ